MKTATERKRKERASRKQNGLKRLELWVKPALENKIKAFAKSLENHSNNSV